MLDIFKPAFHKSFSPSDMELHVCFLFAFSMIKQVLIFIILTDNDTNTRDFPNAMKFL